MPLSAAFHFFSPFLYEKKYHIQPFSLIHFFLLFHIFLFSFHLSPVNSLSTPIFVILLLLLKHNKKLGDFRVNRLHP